MTSTHALDAKAVMAVCTDRLKRRRLRVHPGRRKLVCMLGKLPRFDAESVGVFRKYLAFRRAKRHPRDCALQLLGGLGDGTGASGHFVDSSRSLLPEVHRLGQPLAREPLELAHQTREARTFDGMGRGWKCGRALCEWRAGGDDRDGKNGVALKRPTVTPDQKAIRTRNKATTASRTRASPPGEAMYCPCGVTSSQGNRAKR